MTMPSFTIDGNSLKIDADGRLVVVDFRWPIAQVLPLDSVFVVRTDPTPGACENRNVCAVDRQGQVRWKVRARKHVYDDSPYTNIALVDGKLLLINWDGLTVSVDPETLIEKASIYGR